MLDRDRLQRYTCLVCHTDGKGDRLSLRFCGVDDELNRYTGTFGHMRHAGAHADSVECYSQPMDEVLKSCLH